MTFMQQTLRSVLTCILLWVGHGALAQNVAWVQVEASPTLSQAEARARLYANALGNVSGFRLTSGWYAIALGPYAPEDAPSVLRGLRASRSIPADSFIADGNLFRDQFWPVGVQPGGVTPLIVPAPEPAPLDPVAEPTPGEETPAQARASEQRLTRADREEIQRALQAGGHYSSRIDGSFGRGTRSAMARWQAENGYETTGVLTTLQRQELVSALRAAVSALGMSTYVDDAAGIEIDLPLSEVTFAAYEAPFARFEAANGPAQVLLISQSGNSDTLRGLYDVLQTLEIVPVDGDRTVGQGRFRIEGANADIVTHIEAILTTDGVKGFGLVWPQGDELRRKLTLDAMQASFQPIAGTVLPDTAGDRALQRPDLLSGLQIRQSDRAFSGVYVSSDGAVLTASAGLEACARITLEDEVGAQITAQNDALGLALLRPVDPLAPLGVGRLQAEPPRLNSEIAVAGYSYGGVLGAPTLSFGRLTDLRDLSGDEARSRLALVTRPGDAGGPVLDAGGGVIGLLLPRATDAGQSLPGDVQFAADAATVAAFLGEAGITLQSADGTKTLDAAEIEQLGADMTVLVECWN